MIIVVYTLLAWVFISLFSIIPKSLSKIENIIIFFYISIIVINIKTIISLNLKFVENSEIPHQFICLWINRNIIIPLCVLIFINLFKSFSKKSKKICLALITFFILIFVEILPVWIGIKIYVNWNVLYDGITSIALMATTLFLIKILKKLDEVDEY